MFSLLASDKMAKQAVLFIILTSDIADRFKCALSMGVCRGFERTR